MAGTLYVVGTPIGNLSDLTFRAETTLKAVNLIAAEDTRTSRKLLGHYNIGTPLIAYHDNNEINQAKNLVNKLNSGDSIAIISDAGRTRLFFTDPQPIGRLRGSSQRTLRRQNYSTRCL